MAHWDRLDRFLGRIEKMLLVVLLATMVLMAFTQIVLRNIFETGIDWGDSLVRYLVVWVGFIGAALATREGKHIKIDVFSNWLPGIGKNINYFIIHLFSCFICGLLTYASSKFVRNEYRMGTVEFFDFPIWLFQIVIPAAFGLMTLRYALRTFKELLNIIGADSIPKPERD
jgi:TRAP-type C4-dicarboxylate transport system permease small subunit